MLQSEAEKFVWNHSHIQIELTRTEQINRVREKGSVEYFVTLEG